MTKKLKLEFTLRGRKHTYLRRLDTYGKPLTTTNLNSARGIKEGDIPGVIKLLIQEYGKENITDIKPINDGDQ